MSASPAPVAEAFTASRVPLPNSTAATALPAPAVDTQQIAAEQLRSFIERIERLKEEVAGLNSDIKDIFAEAKGTGFDVKALRKIIAFRKMDHAQRCEEEAILELYMQALGMS